LPSALAPAQIILPSTFSAVVSDVYGVDIDCLNGVGFVLGLASGLKNLANALARRLITPRGGLFYDPDYGFDIRAYLNIALTRSKQGELVSGIEDECRKDARVQNVLAQVTAVGFPATNLGIALRVTPGSGPTFPLILSIGNLVSGLTIAA
jgi:hypothetical protein